MIKIKSVITYLLFMYIFTLPLFTESLLSGRAGDLLLLLILLSYTIGILTDKEIRQSFISGIKNIHKDLLDIFIVILFIVMSISISYSHDKSIAVTETLRFLSYFILYFIIKYEISCEKIKENMLKIYIAISTILGLMGVIQYLTCYKLDKRLIYGYKFGAVRRIPVTMTNPNNYGAFLILAIFPILLLAVKTKKISQKIIYSAIFILLFINIFLTISRNALLGFGLGCLVLAVIYSWKLIFVAGGVGVLGLFVPQIFKRISQIFDSSLNVARVNLWTLAYYMIKDYPIFGVGNGNFVSLYDTYAKKYPDLRYFRAKSYPCHNSYIKVQTELGIMGTLSFAGVLVTAWIKVRSMLKNCNNDFVNTFYTGFLASMIAFYFMNALDNLFFVPKTTTYFWVLLAISQSFSYRYKL